MPPGPPSKTIRSVSEEASAASLELQLVHHALPLMDPNGFPTFDQHFRLSGFYLIAQQGDKFAMSFLPLSHATLTKPVEQLQAEYLAQSSKLLSRGSVGGLGQLREALLAAL